MEADSVTDSTVLRTDQSSRCRLAGEIDFSCVPKWALIKSEEGLLIAFPASRFSRQTFLFTYAVCRMLDVHEQRGLSDFPGFVCCITAPTPVSAREALWISCLFSLHRGMSYWISYGGWEALMLWLTQSIIRPLCFWGAGGLTSG